MSHELQETQQNCSASRSRAASTRSGRSRLLAHLDRCADCAELIEIMELNIVQLENVPEPPCRPVSNSVWPRSRSVNWPRPAPGAAKRQRGWGPAAHWLFSNAAAAVILAVFITANLTWFNPDFQDSIHGCRRLINDKSAQGAGMASDWGAGLNDLKQKVESRMDMVRDADGRTAKDTDETEADTSGFLVTEIIRALGLIGA